MLFVHPDYDRRMFLPLALLLPLSLLHRRRFPLAVLALNLAAWIVIDTQEPDQRGPAHARDLPRDRHLLGRRPHRRSPSCVAGALLVVSVVALAGTIADANEGTLLD